MNTLWRRQLPWNSKRLQHFDHSFNSYVWKPLCSLYSNPADGGRKEARARSLKNNKTSLTKGNKIRMRNRNNRIIILIIMARIGTEKLANQFLLNEHNPRKKRYKMTNNDTTGQMLTEERNFKGKYGRDQS